MPIGVDVDLELVFSDEQERVRKTRLRLGGQRSQSVERFLGLALKDRLPRQRVVFHVKKGEKTKVDEQSAFNDLVLSLRTTTAGPHRRDVAPSPGLQLRPSLSPLSLNLPFSRVNLFPLV